MTNDKLAWLRELVPEWELPFIEHDDEPHLPSKCKACEHIDRRAAAKRKLDAAAPQLATALLQAAEALERLDGEWQTMFMCSGSPWCAELSNRHHDDCPVSIGRQALATIYELEETE